MRLKSKRKQFGRKSYAYDPPRTKRKIKDDFSNVSLKKGKLITIMISNFPKNQTQYSLNAFLKNKGILCWGCRANYPARVAFIDVEVKDCEKVLALNEQEWEGSDLVVKIDETTNVRKKRTKTETVQKFETVERHRRTLCCKNVPFDVFSQKIETLFKGVKEVYIVRNKRTDKPTGIAFIEFFTEEDLEAAFEKKDAVRINGRKLELSRCEEEDTNQKQDLQSMSKYLPKSSNSVNEMEFEDKPESKKSFFDRNKTKKGVKTIVMSNFSKDLNQLSIIKFLKGRGISVSECRANFETQVAFLDVESRFFQKALRLNSKLWNGQRITVEEETKNTNQISHVPKSRGADSTEKDATSLKKTLQSTDSQAERTLCCKNLPFGIFAQKIEIFFHDVREVRNLHDSAGQPTGMAYIEFETKEALDAVYAKKDDLYMDGRKLQLSLMGPLSKSIKPTFKPTAKKTVKSTEMKSESPEPKRQKKSNKHKKVITSSNKFMRR